MSDSHSMLEQLLNAPDLARIVPQLPAEQLHRVIQACGLEACAELVPLATPAQLGRVIDLDVWRAPRAGASDRFDPDRFALWIAVLLESGEEVAADVLFGLDVDLAVAGLTRALLVFDAGAVAGYTMLDGLEVPGRVSVGATWEVGGYVLEARGSAPCQPLVDLLAYIQMERPAGFDALMRRCVALSSGSTEQDGFHDLLHAADQHMFDLGAERDDRRARQGYVAAAQARAFLQGAREVRLGATVPPASAIADACVRALEPDAAGARLGLVDAHAAADAASAERVGFLANVLLAGCSLHGRPFAPREAWDGALAVCKLGLESWPDGWPAADPVAAFQVGWMMLHRLAMHAAGRLAETLDRLQLADPDTRFHAAVLCRELRRHGASGEPWRARPAFDVLLAIDATAWAALTALIAECPVLPDALLAAERRARTIDPARFEFIAQSAQLAAVRDFLESLPVLLSS